jgi:hypothetical protein
LGGVASKEGFNGANQNRGDQRSGYHGPPAVAHIWVIELIVATPIVSASLIAARLGVTLRAAQDLVAELGLREVTGRKRYRAWGVL